jgi:hypothetical protein
MQTMKRFLTLILLLGCLTISYGQAFKGGLRVGFTGSQISGDDLSGFHKFGAYAGGFVNVPISPNGKWKIQPEINFTMKGSSTYYRGVRARNATNKYVLTLLYVDVPIFFKWNPWRGLELEAGPSFNILCYAEERNVYGKMPGRKPFRWGELAGTIGVSYLFKEHYGIDLRWSCSIIPVRIPDWVVNRRIWKQYNDVLAFSFFYQF